MTLKRIIYGAVAFILLSGAAFQYRGIRHDLVNVVTSSSTRVLTNTSTQVQRFTGSTVQRVDLPNATTLQSGMWYLLINESSTRVDVYNNANELVTQITGASQSAPVSKRLYLTSNSTSGGPWTIDQGAGTGSSSSTGSTEFAGEAYIAGTSGCLPSRSSSTFGGLSDVSACPGPTIVTENLGDWQTTDQNNIMFTINNLPAGTYMFILNLYIDPPTAQWCSWYLGDGTTGGSMVSSYEASANAFTTGTSVLIVTYSTTQSVVTFRPIMATNAGGTCYAYNYNTVDSSAHFESRLTAIRIKQ